MSEIILNEVNLSKIINSFMRSVGEFDSVAKNSPETPVSKISGMFRSSMQSFRALSLYEKFLNTAEGNHRIAYRFFCQEHSDLACHLRFYLASNKEFMNALKGLEAPIAKIKDVESDSKKKGKKK